MTGNPVWLERLKACDERPVDDSRQLHASQDTKRRSALNFGLPFQIVQSFSFLEGSCCNTITPGLIFSLPLNHLVRGIR